MAFNKLQLGIIELLESTYISEMRLILNTNLTLVQSTLEDLINTLEIDLVNKHIGSTKPVNKIFTKDIVISNGITFTAGSNPSAATIAELVQDNEISTFIINNINFDGIIESTTKNSKIVTPTLIIGTDDSEIAVDTPLDDQQDLAKGLYVGDNQTPVKSRLSGEVEFPTRAIIQSYTNHGGTFSPRIIDLAANSTLTYSYGKVVLSRKDPQFIYLNLKYPPSYTSIGNPIWLLLHEDVDNRPAPGQSFTIIINDIAYSDGNTVNYANLPTITNAPGSAGINIMSGTIKDGPYKRAYINSSKWSLANPSIDTDEKAVNGFTSDSLMHAYRFGNSNFSLNNQFRPRESTITVTKATQDIDYSNYIISNSNNMAMIKN